jgi:retron-type reverse transcriptase
MTVAAFEQRKDELLQFIHGKLEAGTYRFKPARRVLIPKAGTSKKRKLGIPVVMDRVVGRSQHQAKKHVQDIVNQGYEWCASIDLASFFDEIPMSLF